MEDEVILQLKVKHFVELEFGPLIGNRTQFSLPGCDCAIEKALKEHFSTPHVCESVNFCTIQLAEHDSYILYSHEEYGKALFLADQEVALTLTDKPDDIIREIKLIK